MQNIIEIPLDVPDNMKEDYLENYKKATKGTGNLMLFAGDQRIEHLNDDFYGKGIDIDDADPKHLFEVAQKAKIGVFACQLGLISKYGKDYRDIQYLVKLNSKTNLTEPFSEVLSSVSEVVEFKQETNLNIVGVGYTVYIGSDREAEMLKTASEVIREAHENGLIVVLWMYPRGEKIKDELDPHLIAGAAGVAVSLGSDFAKINCVNKKEFFEEVVKASGKTGIVCSGGEAKDETEFLKDLSFQLENGIKGSATGRNIHQKSLKDAVLMCNAIYDLVVEREPLKEVLLCIK